MINAEAMCRSIEQTTEILYGERAKAADGLLYRVECLETKIREVTYHYNTMMDLVEQCRDELRECQEILKKECGK